jgi:adenylate cyclase
MGKINREIKILNNSSVAGHVFTSGESMIIQDVSANEYFNPSIDKETGYHIKTILCVPIQTVRGEIISVAQMLNKKTGYFTENNKTLIEGMTAQAAISLQYSQVIKQMDRSRMQGMEFFDVVSDVTSEINLSTLLQKMIAEETQILHANCSTLFSMIKNQVNCFRKSGKD